MPAEAIYEVNQPIEFRYRCNGAPAGANPVIEVLDETGVVDVAFPPIILAQIGTSRLFSGIFTPDAVGTWALHITDDNGGDVVKDFPVGLVGVQSGLQSLAASVITIDGKIDVLDGKVDDLAADTGGAHFG